MLFTILRVFLVIFITSAAQHTALAGKCGLDEYGNVMRLYGAYDRAFIMPELKEHKVNISGCGPSSYNKYLMIKTGPDILGIKYEHGYEHKEDYVDDYRVIKNAPFERSSYSDRIAYFKEERKFVQTCVLTEITEKGPTPLVQPPQQIGCNVEKINSQTAQFTGSICYFKFSPFSSFEIKYRFNPLCNSKKFLLENKIQPHDVQAHTGFYISDTASGEDDFEDIAERQLRVTLEPSPKLLPLASNYGQDTIKWPNEVAYDVHMGSIRLSQKFGLDYAGNQRLDEQYLNMSFLINNQCKKQVCVDGFCSSLCDRVVPVGASVKVYRLPKDGEREFVDSWYSGFAALGRWQGFSPEAVRTFAYSAFKPGMRYRIDADLSYLDQYYRLAVDQFKMFILELPERFPGIVGRDPLPELNPFPQFVFRIPKFPELPGLPGDLTPKFDPFENFFEQLAANATYFGQTDWPPYLARYCDDSTGKCQKLYNGEAHTNFWLEFDIDKFNDATNMFDLKNVKWGRNSNVFSSYTREGEFPQCFAYENSLYINGSVCN